LAITWQAASLPGPRDLYRKYLEDPESLAARFPGHPREPGWRARRLAYLGRRDFDRPALAAALAEYNASVGAGSAAVANARGLADPQSFAVIGGQQAGVLTGPHYTISKIVTVLRLARRYAEDMGVKAIPCFWVAAEDHDLAEVDHAWLVDGGGSLTRLQLELPESVRGLPMGSVPLGDSASRLLTAVGRALPPSEHRAWVLELLEETAGASRNLADWHVRILARLFDRWGLVLVNPTDPAFARLATPAFDRFLERGEDLASAVEQGTRAVEVLGFSPQFQPEPGHAHVFLTDDQGRRVPLFRMPGGFRVGRAGGRYFGLDAALRLNSTQPGRLTSSVVTRPLVQDAVLPVLVQVAGPGEVGYHAQLTEAFERLGGTIPPLWPRMSFTVVDGPISRWLERYQLGFEQGLPGLRERLAAILHAREDPGFASALAEARASLDRHYRAMREAAGRLDPGLEGVARDSHRRMSQELERLEQRAAKVNREQQDTLVRHFQQLEASLFPQGRPQERVLNVIPWLSRYGPSFLEWLVQAPPDADCRHSLLLL
jgi:bacillithiol biosynthesis cysteine-adding enzyme BshC